MPPRPLPFLWPDAVASRAARPIQERNMAGNKWNSVLLTLFSILLVLCSSGYALKCFECPTTDQICTANKTCPAGDYSCLRVTVGKMKTYRCELHSNCKLDILKKDFGNSFEFSCCQDRDLCNAANIIPIHKTLFGLLTLTVILCLFCF